MAHGPAVPALPEMGRNRVVPRNSRWHVRCTAGGMRHTAIAILTALSFPISCGGIVEDRSSSSASGITTVDGSGSACTLTIVDPGASFQPPGACVCTRRDAVPAGDCTRGSGASASTIIGPEGGTVSVLGSAGVQSGVAFSIELPPGAIATPTRITVTELTAPPPDGMVDWSPVYRIEPLGLALAAPARLIVPTSQGRGTAFADRQSSIFWSGANDCALERLPSSYMNAGFMQGNVGRLGYAVAGYAHLGEAEYCK
jgi:hypothetical protein